MKCKVMLLLAIFWACAAVSAQTVEFKEEFRPGKEGFPEGWAMHTWEGYSPFPTASVSVDKELGKNVLNLTNVQSSYGGAIQTIKRFPVRSGSIGRISIMARGKGTAWVTFYRWGANREWNGVVTSDSFVLSDLWQRYEFLIPIDDGSVCQTESVTLAIGGKTGAELTARDLHMYFESSNIFGDLRFPRRWTGFACDQNVSPKIEQLTTIPKEWGNAKEQKIFLNANSFDLAQIIKDKSKNIWLFGSFNAPYDCECTLGSGCDKPFRCYHDGKLVMENKEEHAKHFINIDNLVKTVKLHKGENIIALEIPNATPDTILQIADPVSLRGITRSLQIVSVESSENFDSQSVKCSGNPKLIKGNPTPGLLTLTGQGVFQTKGSPLVISLPAGKAATPLNNEYEHYSSAGMRIQHFDREDGTRTFGTCEILCASSGVHVKCGLESVKDSEFIKVSIQTNDKTKPVLTSIPIRMLPADFVFGLSPKGNWAFSCSSLADSRTVFLRGTWENAAKDKLKSDWKFQWKLSGVQEADAHMTIDNLACGQAIVETNSGSAPFKTDLAAQFDPVKAGWPLVFADEFDGNSVDLDKWFFSPRDQGQYAKVHDGLVEITADWNKEKTKVKSVSLYSVKRYGYGYYETRVKFRKQSGWWSAFWLCSQGPSNPFTDGWEIDIYEDYYMGPAKPGEAPRGVLDHNLHVFAVGTLRSWNYNSKLPGSVDDFYVVGCKWTPFEVSYYLNGKLIKSEAKHSPYDSVTFDPFNHAAGFVPLHAILSGCCGRSGGDPKKGTFPESFYVDYVRIYEAPSDDNPSVVWTKQPKSDQMLKVGDSLHFEAEASPSKKTGAKISRAYLFDSGALLESKSVPPFSFDVSVTGGYYDRTDFAKPGRSGIRPNFDRGTHAYVVFVQDEKGNVAHTEPNVQYIRKNGTTRPYQGNATKIPGPINLSHFDEGGDELGYSDATVGNNVSTTFRPNESVDAGPNIIGSVSSGEWLKYTVQATKSGRYKVTFRYGTPARDQIGPKLLIDGKAVGEFETPAHEAPHWGADTDTTLENITLTEGTHEIVLLLQGSYNISTLTFELDK